VTRLFQCQFFLKHLVAISKNKAKRLPQNFCEQVMTLMYYADISRFEGNHSSSIVRQDRIAGGVPNPMGAEPQAVF
jgi:hypothetical protein